MSSGGVVVCILLWMLGYIIKVDLFGDINSYRGNFSMVIFFMWYVFFL